MPGRFRRIASFLSSRRIRFWILTALAVHALSWLVILNHHATFNAGFPQYFFGYRIGHDLSMNLALVEMAGAFLSGLSLIVLPLAVALNAVIRRIERRPAAGFCQTCGYDLRATPDRCPECGIKPHVGAG